MDVPARRVRPATLTRRVDLDDGSLASKGVRCATVQADVGIDDEKGDQGSVVFQIWRDSTKIADSGTMTGTAAAKRLTGSLSGGTTLRLVVTDAGDGINYDHADWANPQITCT